MVSLIPLVYSVYLFQYLIQLHIDSNWRRESTKASKVSTPQALLQVVSLLRALCINTCLVSFFNGSTV